MKLAIFDLDGTLLNTLPDIHNCINYSLRHFLLPTNTLEQTRMYIGNGALNLVKRSVLKMYDVKLALTSPLTEEVYNLYNKYYYENGLVLTKPFPNIIEIIKELKLKGIKIAVLSNKPDDQAKKIVMHYFGDLFDYVSGAKENVPLKPNPTAILNIIDRFNVKLEDTIYIGDSIVDIDASRNAKIKVISCAWGYQNKEILSLRNPDFLIDSPNDLLNILVK